ncbi:MAG: peptide chain release factor-like protein [Chlamydiia bacterium]|nr:peptide chain release factor-like protein [Chlamydiia bacterium]
MNDDRWTQICERLTRLGIEEDDLIEKFILGSGKGGQKMNKTSSCVYLHHPLTGIEVKCQQERSRELNRLLARQILCDRLEGKIEDEKQEIRHAREKRRRQHRRRSPKAKEKMLEDKRKHAEKKERRHRPDWGQA